jgi:Flagellar hook-length control protein FliK
MQPLAVDPRVLRAVLGTEIKVMPGRALMARVVVADERGRGSLSIAGFLVEAELPPDVRTGDDLRLIVREVTPERVVLSLSDDQTASVAQQAVPPAPVAIPLPGGATLQVTEHETHSPPAASPDSHTLALRFQAPALGDVDLRFALDAGALRLGVTVDPGEPLDAARADAETLRAALSDAGQRAISITVTPRRQPLDLYA